MSNTDATAYHFADNQLYRTFHDRPDGFTLEVIDTAKAIVAKLTSAQRKYAADPARGEFRGFAALHDLCDANLLLPTEDADGIVLPASDSAVIAFHNAAMEIVTALLIATPTPYETGEWLPNSHRSHSRKVGTLELLEPHTFTQYGQNAADTDYIACQPQTVDVMQHGDTYWICASFAGVLEKTTRTYMVKVGQPAQAHMQTQSFGGVKHWSENPLFCLTITHPALSIQEVGKYADGSPMTALRQL